MLSRKHLRYIWLFIIVGLVILINIFGREQSARLKEELRPRYLWATPFGHYSESSLSKHFEKVWEIKSLYITTSNFGRNLLVSDKKVYFVGSFETGSPLLLHKLDLLSGEFERASDQKVNSPTVMTNNSNNVFIASGGPSTITAYDSGSGQEVWKRQLPVRMKSTEYMFANSDNLYINTVPVHIEIIDTATGLVIKEDLSEDFFPVFLVDDGTIYHRTLSNGLQATSKLTGDILWEIQFNEEILLIPIFTNEHILVRTGHPSRGQLSVIERATGNVLWESPQNIVSNVSVDGENIFYLTDQSRLIAQDIQTGEKRGEEKFSPELLDMDNHDFSNREFSVIASNSFVLVYFGSSWQLFAFRYFPES